jgi:hypothetical protein
MNGIYKMKYEGELEALRSVIEDSGKSYKDVAVYLFPHMKPDSAYAFLKSALNYEKKEKLSFGQIIAMSKFCNRADALFFLCDELGYERPKLKPIESEEDLLLQELLKTQQQMQELTKKIEKSYSKSERLLSLVKSSA